MYSRAMEAGLGDVTDNTEQRRYELRINSAVAGHIRYQTSRSVVTLIHTEILPPFRGKGLGERLAAGALDDLQSRGLQVTPLCPVVASYIRRHTAYAGLVVD